ncbi:DUF674 family protein [Quillaja saponaria]|uniref:DUF674 family protein n=1 Tax=Quillaja saponaria TaxID=32244 RepID=A0AAD7LNA5_QUISA|nr:DUF674 family protein [Quillaja saponaria]
MIYEKSQPSSSVGVVNEGGAFVKESVTFIISDGLNVLPNYPGESFMLLRNLAIKDMNAIEERTVNICLKEMMDLLRGNLLIFLTINPLIWRTLNRNMFPNL